MGWHIHQMYVKTAFLNGIIEEEVYIEQPEGFKIFSSESHVCRLKRESMPERYWRSFTCKAASLLKLLFLVVGGKRMLHRQR